LLSIVFENVECCLEDSRVFDHVVFFHGEEVVFPFLEDLEVGLGFFSLPLFHLFLLLLFLGVNFTSSLLGWRGWRSCSLLIGRWSALLLLLILHLLLNLTVMVHEVACKLLHNVLGSKSLLLSLFVFIIFQFFIHIHLILYILVLFILSFTRFKLRE
jgi:hypothetical protein